MANTTTDTNKKRLQEMTLAQQNIERGGNITKVTSRSTGSDPSTAVDLTNLSPQDREKIQMQNALEGLARKSLIEKSQKVQAEQNVLNQEADRVDIQQTQQPIQANDQIGQQPIQTNDQIEKVSPSIGEIAKRTGKLFDPTDREQRKGSLENVKEGIGVPIKAFAEILDATVSIFSQKKQTKVIAAEGALNDMMAVLDGDIQLVASGQKSNFEVKREIDQADKFISRLESTQKGLGILNLRYWLTDGKEVEAKVALERQNLEDFRLKLIVAEQEGRLNRARLSIGQ